MVQKDVQFLMKNNKVLQPFIPTDGLELYYDVKGKKNTDNYKDTLLDMSGNGRHGTLSNFAYEGVSGFTGTPEGGLLLDDVDDKLVRPAITGIEYTSASRNLLNTVTAEWELGTFDDSNVNAVSTTAVRQINTMTITPSVDYTLSVLSGYLVSVNVNGANTAYAQTVTLNSQSGIVRIMVKKADDSVLTTASATTALIQLEKGSVATAYTPYIPLPIMTYQMNGNVISFEKDGTVKRTTKDVNGNEVVVSRKGINLIRNGNFALETNGWTTGDSNLSVYDNILSITGNGSSIQTTAKKVIPVTENNKYHQKIKFRVTNSICKFLQIRLFDGKNWPFYSISSPVENQWYEVDNIVTALNSIELGRVEIVAYYANTTDSIGRTIEVVNISTINLTHAYGAGNEPTLAYIQAHPEEFAWTPNPNDLIETVEIKNNLVGDLENLQGNDFEQHEDGIITYTNEAEEGSVVRVDIDGISDQPLRFRNATGEQVVITEHDQTDEDAIKKVEFQGNSVQLADKYREVSGTSMVIAPELHDKNVADKLVIGGNTTQYTESSNVVTDGLQMWLSGRNFSNSTATTVWKDLTGVNNGTASGFAFTSESGSDGNGGVVFDGVDDYVSCNLGNLKNMNSIFTIETRFKLLNTSSYAGLFKRASSYTTANSEFEIYFQPTGSSLTIVANRHTGTPLILYNGGVGLMPLNTPITITVTYNYGILKIYNNGVLFVEKSTQHIPIGNSSPISYPFKGYGAWYISPVGYFQRIYNRALSDAEVLQNYNAGLAIPIPNIAMPQEVKHVTSGSKVLVHGKNLFDSSKVGSNTYITKDSSNTLIISGNYGNTMSILSPTFMNLLPNTTYTASMTISGTGTLSASYARVALFNGTTWLHLNFGGTSGAKVTTFTTPSDIASYKYFYAYGSGDKSAVLTISNIQIEEGSTATAYEPFKGYQETTIPVTLKSIG